jgi:hypothetical protein
MSKLAVVCSTHRFYLVVPSDFRSNSSDGLLWLTLPSCILNSNPIVPYLICASMPDVTSSNTICWTRNIRTVSPFASLVSAMRTTSPIRGVFYFTRMFAPCQGVCSICYSSDNALINSIISTGLSISRFPFCFGTRPPTMPARMNTPRSEWNIWV